MDQKLDDIKFGLLSEYELSWLKRKVSNEIENREQLPEEYFKVVRCNDGSEGFYCKVDRFGDINSERLHAYIAQTLGEGSGIDFSVEDVDKEEYEENCKRYEWDFERDEDQEKKD